MNKIITLKTIISSIIIISFLSNCAGISKPIIKDTSSSTIKTYPQKEPKAVGDIQYGVSSYYAEKFHGRRTANGEIYDMYGVSGAHQTLPLNSTVRVTNLENNKAIILKVNDRGPFIKNRIFDCSYGAAIKLDFVSQGTAIVKVEVIKIGNNQYNKE